jgi:hypothetical protein
MSPTDTRRRESLAITAHETVEACFVDAADLVWSLFRVGEQMPR